MNRSRTRRAIVALLLVLGVAGIANQAFAAVEESGTNENPRLTNIMVKELGSYAAKLRGSAVVGDTTYVGYTPGKASNKNPWSIGAGFSPQNSNIAGDGRAYRRPYAGQGGMWDWEPTGGSYIKGDSLQGWWPDRAIMTGTAGLTLPDWNRPWWAIDIGNKASYRLNKAGNRTYGVIGVWHRDDAGAPLNAPGTTAPSWTPIGGSFSAWMGLRASGDTRVVDAITGQPFNEDVLLFSVPGSATATGSDNGFPGYGSQMDQMLYRDIDMTGNTARDLQVSFTYRLRMSTGFGTAAATRVGWFDKDPLEVTAGFSAQSAGSLGNFISSTDAGAAGAPRDSFMVYVGAPVEGTFLASTGASLPVFDAQRRWFDEVVRANETGLYKELHSDTGLVLPTTKTVTIPNTTLAPMLTASQGRVRLVFRVKTNRGFDDQGTAYSSSGAGAAVVDNVTYQMVGGPGSPAGWGDFESEGSINNAVSTPATEAWKATGKPPGHYAHVAELATLLYEDLCGQPGDASRICSLDGVVVSLGDFDNNEAASGLFSGNAEEEAWQNCFSPTIQLRSDNGVWPNPIGLKTPSTVVANGDANATEDYWVDYEMYAGIMDPFSKGMLWRYGIMSWPAKGKVSLGGYPNWSNVRYPPYLLFNPDQQCFRDILDNPIKGNGMLVYDAARSESPDWPDSVRIVIGNRQECYRFGGVTCASTDGNYWDNVSLAIIDGDPQPIQAQIWDLYQDTFPANETPGLPGIAAAFDTTAAWIKTGVNIAPTGPNRFDVPGDSVAITTSDGDNTRVDLVFRILPGPGNYVNLGRPDLSTLRKLPNSPTPIGAPSSASSDFWENYLANNGPKGTPGGHGGVWNPNVWNSARMDTAEVAIFAFQGRGIVGGPGAVTGFQGTYHESDLGIGPDPNTEAGGDPYPVTTLRAALGIPRSRCFVAAAGAVVTDVQCNGAVPSYVGTVGVPNPLTGFNGTATTIEGTKIIPDGYLTPGAHVQYFFRREDATGGVVTGLQKGLMPDTNHVFPQNGEGSTDGHRWQQFGVLPDRWKSPFYRHPVFGTFGVNDACMLAVDNNDRRGDERVFIGVADSIGWTQALKYGAHNGWHAPGTGNDAVNNPASFVSKHLGQAGTIFDLYNIKASESLNTNSGSLGARLAFRDASNTQITGKSARNAPTPDMLKAYYKVVFQFTGDLNSSILGPFANKTSNDVRILTNWLESGDPTVPTRAYWAMGNGFVESNFSEGTGSDQDLFNVNYLGVDLRNNSYVLESGGNTERTPDLYPPVGSPLAGFSDIYGVQSLCLWTNDVILRTPGLSAQTQNMLAYEDAGPGPLPLLSSVSKSHTSLKPWVSLVDGWDMINLRNRFDTSSKGRLRYLYEVMGSLLGPFCYLGEPGGMPYLEMPTGSGTLVDFVGVPWNNPMRGGVTTIAFGLATAGAVDARLYDIAGREVRVLARRRFPAGEHSLSWDGTDDAGHRLARGVYFAKIRFADRGTESTTKIVMLK